MHVYKIAAQHVCICMWVQASCVAPNLWNELALHGVIRISTSSKPGSLKTASADLYGLGVLDSGLNHCGWCLSGPGHLAVMISIDQYCPTAFSSLVELIDRLAS